MEDRIIVFKYIFATRVLLIMAPGRQKICVVGTWRNPPNVRYKNAPVPLENKINCSLTIVCASSLRPSQNQNWRASCTAYVLDRPRIRSVWLKDPDLYKCCRFGSKSSFLPDQKHFCYSFVKILWVTIAV